MILALAAAVLIPQAGDRFIWKASKDSEPPPAQGASVTARDGTILVLGPEATRYTPGKGWGKAAPAPSPLGASPAVAYGPCHVLVFTEDGVLGYHTVTDTWTRMGSLPAGFRPAAAAGAGKAILLVDASGHTLRGEPVERRGSFSPLDTGVLAAYFLGMLAIGWATSRGERTTGRFFVAGGRIPWWAAGLSIFGTQLSAVTFLSIPAKAYATDWVYVLVNLCVFAIAPVIILVYLPFYCRLRVTSAYEYLERRFNLPVRLFGTLSFSLFQLGRMAIQMYLPALAISQVIGIDVTVAILIVGAVTTFYCMRGGAEAVVWTEVVQCVLLLASALVSLGILVAGVEGGLPGVVEAGRAHDKFHMTNWTWDMTTTAVWVVVVGSLFNNLIPYTADQAVIQRYMTTRDEKQAARSIWTNAFLTLVATALFFGLGSALFAFYRTRPQLLDPGMPADGIFPLFMAQQLPAGVLGLVVAGLLSASMSGGINAIATALTTDLYRRFRPEAPDARCLRMAVGLTGALGLAATAAALVLAASDIRSVWDTFLTFLGLFGGSLAGLFALGILTRRAHGAGAVVGAAAGAAATFAVQSLTPVSFFLYAGTGIVTCFVAGYLASLVLPGRPRDLAGLTLYTRGTP